MVTSNKFPEKKVVKMAEQNNSVVVPHRTLLGEVNEHITCPLCRGYYIDATTIVECLHSFCRSCIIKHLQAKSYCPECEMMINSARPNIKPDKALQDIVYKLVPGLFQREMERRQQFYSSRPGPAATATPEQRGEDTERIIFSPEDVISFSLEYADATDTDSISSKSSDSNDQQPSSTRRFLQCPAVVNISHLKKFISMKFDIDSTQYSIDILYKKVPLPDYYTLMDIAYIYNWKRNEPMRFFYQITDYIAIRTRYGLFDLNSKGSHFHDHKSSPTPTEETNADSPAPNINDHRSEASSGTDSPMPEDSAIKKATDVVKKFEKQVPGLKDDNRQEGVGTSKNSSLSKKCDDEVEKSQFLNSFELTAKSNSCLSKPASLKSINDNGNTDKNDKEIVPNVKVQFNSSKVEDTLKRKTHTSPKSPEVKKIKIELDKIKIQPKIPPVPSRNILHSSSSSVPPTLEGKNMDIIIDKKKELPIHKIPQSSTMNSPTSTPTSLPLPVKDIKQNMVQKQQISKIQTPENAQIKRPIPGSHHIPSPKKKTNDNLPVSNKAVSPLKLQSPKAETSLNTKSAEALKPTVKKMPDLKPSGSPGLFGMQNKGQIIGKVRMDLLANNSDPTIDRSKILSQVKSSLGNQNPVQMPGQMSGDPLKSLFDSCKINIPSSLSITLTDQKDQRNTNETPVEQKKNVANKNLSLVGAGTSGAHKVPSPPVHNYIQILKIPDTDPKQQLKSDSNPQPKAALPKNESVGQSKPSNKSSETSAKGPIPSLKPISDTKLAKQSGSGPVTFQQSFERQLLSIQTDNKTKLPKNKTQMPKLMPATPKALSAANKLQTSGVSNTPANPPAVENKIPARTDNALDLSTPHNIHSQLGPQHTKAFETMQSIANLAKKQNLAGKSVPIALSQNMFSISNRSMSTGSMPLKMSPTPTPSPSYQMHDSHPHSSPSTAQPSPRSQTRSPSSSPKLVIAEEKHSSSTSEQNINQSNQITSTQIPSLSASKPESPKSSPGPSKQTMKPVKSLIPGKVSGIRQPMMINNPDFQMQMQHAMLRQHMEIQNAWFKAQRLMSHQNINKDNKQ